MTNHAIHFEQVSKSYGSFDVVENFELSVQPGEFLVLLGPSGCGKSTILKMVSGIEAPSSGEIHVNGKMVNYTLPRNRDVAMVFQNYALYPHKSVFENIAYPLLTRRASRPSKAETEQRVREAADIVEITSQLDKYPDALSGGQRQRVALARAIVRDPAVFLMDEPLSNLDAQLRDTMRQQLIALHRRLGKATIYVTHDQLEAMTMASRIVVMNEGKVQQSGTPEEVFQRPANLFVAGFIGHPRMNFLTAHSAGGNSVQVGKVTLRTQADAGPAGRPLTIGLRPTDGQYDRAEGNAISGRIIQSEFTGADAIQTLDFGGPSLLRIRKQGHRKDEIGTDATVTFHPKDIHLFDENGARI
ncbi:ABC transporter ATP-binding protein [Ruegeria sp.]|uniref:ABC transporter ATP-binding protein n=1 Tax=Ruegeria sp. TaxID=1879320 RepID=UPI0023084B12|nr:ABC transporter ATP-binding protein [Ruegeria sp.]MDA7963624.1 ABC transporter ATP-binding protein [Ruegeria sp.]